MSDDLDIEISKVNQNTESQLRKRSTQTETLIDIEKGIFVNFGIPQENGAIIVPHSPHIFIADELRIKDRAGKDLLLKNVVIAMGHGKRDKNDKWKFTEGQRVSDTINSYNEYAKTNGMPKVEFVAVCNKDKITEETGIAVHEQDIDNSIAYAAGAGIHVLGMIEPNGIIRVNVRPAEDIFNLDMLETSKETTIHS